MATRQHPGHVRREIVQNGRHLGCVPLEMTWTAVADILGVLLGLSNDLKRRQSNHSSDIYYSALCVAVVQGWPDTFGRQRHKVVRTSVRAWHDEASSVRLTTNKNNRFTLLGRNTDALLDQGTGCSLILCI